MLHAPDSVKQRSAAPRVDVDPRVFIVDDDISVRESLELLIQAAGWQTLTFACAADFLAHPRVPAPSCLVLDVGLPDMNGLEVQDHFAPERTTTPIVFITGHIDIPTTVRAMKGGAVELLTKPIREDVLLRTIEQAVQLSNKMLRLEAELATVRNRYASLTRREVEVMGLVVAGRLNKQVAAELEISEITVKAHRGKVMRKMQARSLPDLVRMAARLDVAAHA